MKKSAQKTRKKAGKASKPETIEAEATTLWDGIAAEYQIEDGGGKAIIRMGAEATTRLWLAQLQIKDDGMVVVDRWGQRKSHPLLSVERDARAQVLKCLAMLNLDLEPLRDSVGRPPGMGDK